MADPKPAEQTSILPLILIGAMVYFAFSQPQGGGDSSRPVAITATVKQTIPNIRQAYRDAFLQAAKRIEDGTIANQEQWTDFIKANAGAKQREALDAVYKAIDALDLPASFAGKEKEIAELNRRIGGAW